MDHSPNILFLMTDQHRYDVVGFAGNPVVRTPNLDRLAANAVVFDNAYTAAPTCVPSRPCMAMGQRPSSCDCRDYWDDLQPGSDTFPRRFAEQGYQTVCCGKLHHHGIDQGQGFQRLIGMHENTDEAATQAWRRAHDPEAGWTPAKEFARAGVGRGRAITHDAYAIQGALHYVEEYFVDAYYDRALADRPIFLKLSLEQPHQPFFTDEARFTFYLNRVSVFDDTPSGHPGLDRHTVGRGVTARDIRRATAAYYGMVETIDAHFGTLIEALESVGQDLDDWIVVFASDHGEMLGQHGVQAKNVFYEGSARVPLFIRWPRRFAGGKRIAANVSLCDLYPTLADLAGVSAPDDRDGRSLAPLLAGGQPPWPDDEVVSEFHCDGESHLMVKRGELKYLWFGPSLPEVLFDLSDDPCETRNVWDEPRYAGARSGFRRRRDALGFGPAHTPDRPSRTPLTQRADSHAVPR